MERRFPLGPPNAEVAAGFRQTDAPEQLARRIPYRHAAIADIGARIAAAPQISVDVDADAVGRAAYAVHHEVGELLLISDGLAIGAEIEAEHDLAADDVDLLVVGREGDAIAAAAEGFFADHHIHAPARIRAVDVGTPLAFQ